MRYRNYIYQRRLASSPRASLARRPRDNLEHHQPAVARHSRGTRARARACFRARVEFGSRLVNCFVSLACISARLLRTRESVHAATVERAFSRARILRRDRAASIDCEYRVVHELNERTFDGSRMIISRK